MIDRERLSIYLNSIEKDNSDLLNLIEKEAISSYVPIIRKDMQYLYNEGDLYYFMDQETFDQIPLNKAQVEDALNFMTENMVATIQFYKGNAFSVVPPTFVELTITDCEPWIQGDTSKAGYKPATLETGYEILVPMFVNEGDYVRIDTRTGEYMERV